MLRRALLSFAALSWCLNAQAQVNCGPQPADVPPDVQLRIRGDVEGKAQVFTRLLGDVDLKGKVDSSRKEVHQKYRDLDKSVIDRYMIWVSCQNIMQDKELKPPEKNRLWIDIYRELIKPSKESAAPSEYFKDIRFGTTSLDYLISKVGQPTTHDDSIARFDLAGYMILVSFEPGPSSAAKAISGLAVETNGSPIEPSFEISGSWNRKGWCTAVDRSDECQPIVGATGFGQKTLGQYILRPELCRAFWFEHVGDTEGLFRIACDDIEAGSLRLYVVGDSGIDDDYEQFRKLFIEFSLFAPEPAPNPPGVFAPPPLPLLEGNVPGYEENERGRMQFVGKLKPDRLEAGSYNPNSSTLDPRYDDYHRAEGFEDEKRYPAAKPVRAGKR
ncbi:MULTISPECIES: hypothetical protein [unclassified Bradyrhizobium]|uniref:hypothetical protein n=1 Tax=unclassified Bradyrhizobium TaxID=2631580 RepID=UPI00339982E6